MRFIGDPTEQVTAVTDLLLALLAVAGILVLAQARARDAWKTALWMAALAMLAQAAGLGAVAHGFEMSAETNALLWRPLTFALGQLVAFFAVGALYDRWGSQAAKRALVPLMMVGVAFVVITEVAAGAYLVFIAYELVAMTFALLAYGQLALRRAPGAGLLSLGILVSIVAAGIQASPAVVVLGWTFDHNGLYHLIQMVGVVLVVMGIRVSLTRGGARIPELEADPLPALAAAR